MTREALAAIQDFARVQGLGWEDIAVKFRISEVLAKDIVWRANGKSVRSVKRRLVVPDQTNRTASITR